MSLTKVVDVRCHRCGALLRRERVVAWPVYDETTVRIVPADVPEREPRGADVPDVPDDV